MEHINTNNVASFKEDWLSKGRGGLDILYYVLIKSGKNLCVRFSVHTDPCSHFRLPNTIIIIINDFIK